MFSQKLYRETMGELRAPQNKIEEVIEMTQNTETRKTRRPLRVAVVAAAAIALMTLCVAAANPEVRGWIEVGIMSGVQISEHHQQYTLSNGMTVDAFQAPSATVEERDGRTILVVDEDEVDITDALDENGSYTYTVTNETGAVFTAKATQTDGNWFISVDSTLNGSDVDITYSTGAIVTTPQED